MLFVIQKEGDGFHPYQACSAWTSNPYPETHAVVAPELVLDVIDSGGWCDLELSADGTTVVGITPRERVLPEPETPTEDLILEMVAEQEARICALELGI